ncbi:MAG: DEAD/DEAH box helicase, partial [Deltaproteobacteria bacterium]
QATDRAFRIGQKKNVMVHKLLTKGTIEEKIDRMLVAKAKLSDEVVAASGENWLTEMSNEELFELFTLQI